jgi:hypothetical protein
VIGAIKAGIEKLDTHTGHVNIVKEIFAFGQSKVW